MDLKIENITLTHPDLTQIQTLYEEAFPDNEQAPFDTLMKRTQLSTVQCFAFYDQQQFCGFVYLIREDNLIYIFYLAIVPSKRSQGYGGAILEKLKNLYPHCTFFLDIEVIDDHANNALQRHQRKEFYLHHGFESTLYTYRFYQVDYEVLKCGQSFSIEACHDLFYHFSDGEVDIQFQPMQ